MKNFMRRNGRIQKQLDCLNGLASKVNKRRWIKTVVTHQGGCFYLEARCSGQHERLASFEDAIELQSLLIRLSETGPISEELRLKAKRRLWDEQGIFMRKRKELVADAQKLNYPTAALKQQRTMEGAWTMRAREILCAKARNWVDLFGLLPEQVGVSLELHDPGRRNLEDLVFCADCDWLSGEFRSHYIMHFPAVYQRCASWPDQNYMAELRCLRTENIKNTWQQLIADQIYPLMERIKKEGFNKVPGRELICEVKKRIAPWTIPRPWPDEENEKTRLTRVKVGQHIQRLPAWISNTQNDQTLI
jgi:hypothetical protein